MGQRPQLDHNLLSSLSGMFVMDRDGSAFLGPNNHIGHAETDGDNFVLLQQTFPAAASALHEMCGSNSVHIWCYIK